MKRAYELALERLNREHGATKKLTDEQRSEIAEIDKIYAAKIAEVRLKYDAQVSGPEELEAMTSEIAGLETRRDREKDAIWASNDEA